MSGDSVNCEKLYFYIYENPKHVSKPFTMSIEKNQGELKLVEPLDFETFTKKLGFKLKK